MPGLNILITRTDRIGDLVLTLPLASIIKKYLPDSKIAFLVSEYTRAIAENCSAIDEVIIYQGASKKKLTLSKKFDIVICGYPTFDLAWLLFLSHIPIRIGTGYRWYSLLFNKRVYEHRKYGLKNELEYNAGLLRPLGINEMPTHQNVSFNLQPDLKSKQIIDEYLVSLGIDASKKIIIIHPGSGGSASDLPKSHLKELVNQLAHKLDCTILITGSPVEKELASYFVVRNNVHNAAGLFNLSSLIALIDRAFLLIANSTGPLHIAAALGKFVVGFYPKAQATSPIRWGPYTERKLIFTPPGECLDCMKTIDINHVFEEINSKWENI
ncbi:MAG: glycosyltransferase family 9 protein [Melioribacteraceae bacterium]|nr:glycosyltransferase family 9 protein [Melioribacteraceae bacterium]